MEPLVISRLRYAADLRAFVPDVPCVSEEVPAAVEFWFQQKRKQALKEALSENTESLTAVQSTLFAIVLMGAFVTSLLLIGAWKFSDPDAKSANNADFWFMIQSVVMTILGLFTALYPLYRGTGGTPWRWSLVMGGLGSAFALAAIPSYLLLPGSAYPAFCSSTFLFVGYVSQAAITVQLSLMALKSGPHAKQD